MNHATRMLCSLAISFTVLPAWTQNRVPNWSFEEYTECPTNLSQIDYALGWQRIGGSPDLYNSCGVSDTVNVPTSFQGYQEAHTGNGYAGVVTYHWDGREYIQAQLNAPLSLGERCYVSMYVSPGGYANVGQISPELMSSGVGLRMSVSPYPIPDDWMVFDFNAAIVYMDEILQDTATWTRLYAEFVPDSAYEYVQLGNFFAEDSTLGIEVDPDGGAVYAYAFIDDVCISQTPGVCDATNAISSHHVLSAEPGFSVLCDGRIVLRLPPDWHTLRARHD